MSAPHHAARSIPLALRTYGAGLRVLEPAVAGFLALRRRRGKEDPARLDERKGRASLPRPPGFLVWMHGASVGETLSLLPLVEALAARGLPILVTSGTRTSAELLGRRLPPGAVHQYVPVDAPRYVARFLAHWQPDLALLAESEIWPNTVLALARGGTPLVLVNARLSERSARGWARSPAVAAALFGRFALCLAQGRGDADRLTAAGAPHVLVGGNIKLDAPAPEADALALDELRAITAGRPIMLAASTHPGEETAVVAVHRALAPRFPHLLTLVVPRHPARGAEVEALAAGLRTARRSRGDEPGPDVELYVADTLGELGLFYRLAPAAFVGGSLVPKGGQNPVEAVRLGAAILHGPHVGNFAEAYATLDASGAASTVHDPDSLAEGFAALLADPYVAGERARAGDATLAGLTGAVGRTLAALEPFLPPTAPAGLMRAPDFWWRPPGLAAGLLAPTGAVYGALAARRMDRTGIGADLPVVCVGNFTVGGAGKTPTAVALAALLRRAGREPAFLSRGYGGRERGPLEVDPARHDAATVGDEPLLLARHARTVVARDRPAGARLCAALGADVVVMDDGLQNPSLRKDLRIVVVDAASGFGNGRVLPAGPLRAPLARQWPHADALVLVGEGAAGAAVATEAARRGVPVLRARLVPDPAAAALLAGRRVLAFTGIGRPEKFFATLRHLGATVVAARAFPDHHVFTPANLAALAREAAVDDLLPVTTEKDAARLGSAAAAFGERAVTLPVSLSFTDLDAATQMLSRLPPPYRAIRGG